MPNLNKIEQRVLQADEMPKTSLSVDVKIKILSALLHQYHFHSKVLGLTFVYKSDNKLVSIKSPEKTGVTKFKNKI